MKFAIVALLLVALLSPTVSFAAERNYPEMLKGMALYELVNLRDTLLVLIAQKMNEVKPAKITVEQAATATLTDPNTSVYEGQLYHVCGSGADRYFCGLADNGTNWNLK